MQRAVHGNGFDVPLLIIDDLDAQASSSAAEDLLEIVMRPTRRSTLLT